MLGRRSTYVALLTALLFTFSARAEELKKEPVARAQELMERVDTLFKEGHFAQAIPVAEQAVAIREKVLGPEHPDTATSINYLGRLHRFTGNYSRAAPLLKRALAIRENVLGPEHPDTANSLINLGALYHVMNSIGQARSLYIRALAIREKALGPEHPDTATSLNNLALLEELDGNYSRAEQLHKRALAIRQKTLGAEHFDTTESLSNLGGLYIESGVFSKAEPLLLSALSTREKTLGPEHPATASTLRFLALLYCRTGVFNESERLATRALSINMNTLGASHRSTSDALDALGQVLDGTGAYERGEDVYLRALATTETRQDEQINTAEYLIDLGMMYIHSKKFAKAEPLLWRALAIEEKILRPGHPYTAIGLNNLAELYVALGNYSRAEPLYKRALSIKEESLGSEHPLIASSLRNLGVLYQRMGSPTQAEPLFRRALQIREKVLGADHPDTATTLADLAVVLWDRGEFDNAQRLLQRSVQIQARNSARFLLSGSEARKQAYLRGLASDVYRNVSFSVAAPGLESAAVGLESVLQLKGQILDAMSDTVSHLRQSVRAEDRALFKQRAQVATEFSTLVYQGPGLLAPEGYRKKLNDLTGQQDKIEAEIAAHSSQFRGHAAPIVIAGIRRAIPRDSALIEWFRYMPFDPHDGGRSTPTAKPRYVAYVIRQDVDPVAIDIGDAQTVDTLIHGFRTVTSDSKRNDGKANAIVLYDRLMKPLSIYLIGVNHLLMSPDGTLNLLPMAALVNDQGEYLVQRFEVSYLTSGRDLLRDNTTSTATGNAIVMADPDFGAPTSIASQSSSIVQAQRSADLDRSGLIFRPLANTDLEAQDLKKLLNLSESSVFLRDAATEGNLKQLHSPRILHIASHGFFLSDQELSEELSKRAPQGFAVPHSENPLLRSGLALSGANARRSGENDDGILTALEAAQLDLQGTELVVLSACDSGVGDVRNGEGVYGLRRALVLAGAQTQVTSLWKVSDEATRRLMVDFYERLLKGEGRSEALWHAQLALLAIPELAHPYYWASFIPIGNWTPLPAVH